MKSIFASKTMWVALLTALVGILNQATPFIPAQYNGLVLAVVGLVMAILRLVTGQPIGKARG